MSDRVRIGCTFEKALFALVFASLFAGSGCLVEKEDSPPPGIQISYLPTAEQAEADYEQKQFIQGLLLNGGLGMAGVESYVHSVTTVWFDLNSPDSLGVIRNVSVQFFGADGTQIWPFGPAATAQSEGIKSDQRFASAPRLGYVTDRSFNAVRAMNLSNGSVSATIQLPPNGAPWGIASTPDGKSVLVAEEGDTSPVTASSIQIIDTATNKITGAIPLPPQVFPSWIAITPDGRTAYVTNEGYYLLQTGPGTTTAVNSVLIIDIASRSVTGSIPAPTVRNGGPIHLSRLAVSPDGSLLYVAATPGPNNVYAVDTLTNTIIKTIPFDIGGLINDTQVIFHPNGTRAYVTANNFTNVYVAVIDTTNHQVAQTIPLGRSATTQPAGMGLTIDGSTLYVKDYNSGSWLPVDTAMGVVGKPIPAGAARSTVFFPKYP